MTDKKMLHKKLIGIFANPKTVFRSTFLHSLTLRQRYSVVLGNRPFCITPHVTVPRPAKTVTQKRSGQNLGKIYGISREFLGKI
jgi:hypothetical protein